MRRDGLVAESFTHQPGDAAGALLTRVQRFGSLFSLPDPVCERQIDLSFAKQVVSFGIKIQPFRNGSHATGLKYIQDIEVQGAHSFEDILAD